MDNPFKQYLPEEEPPKRMIEDKVMGSIHLKSHFAGILEFFFAIFGMVGSDVSPTPTQAYRQPRHRKDDQEDELDYFF